MSLTDDRSITLEGKRADSFPFLLFAKVRFSVQVVDEIVNQ